MTSRNLTEEEVIRLLSELPRVRDQALLVTGLKTGFRISELLCIRVEDVFDGKQILDSITVQRRNMKGKQSSRTVPLHPAAKVVLAEYLLEYASSGPESRLFPINRKHAWRIISGAAKAAGLSGCISTHSMRKTFGMRVYEVTGKNVVAAQRALGHVSLASTSHYLSIGQEEVNQAILA